MLQASLLERGFRSTQGGCSLWPAPPPWRHTHAHTHTEAHAYTDVFLYACVCTHTDTQRHAHTETCTFSNTVTCMSRRAPKHAPKARHSPSGYAHTHRHVCAPEPGPCTFPLSHPPVRDHMVRVESGPVSALHLQGSWAKPDTTSWSQHASEQSPQISEG